MTLRRKFRP